MVGVLDTLLAGFGAEGRAAASSGVSRPSGWLMDMLGGSESYSGKSVTPESAMRLVPVYSAVARISGDVARTPCIVYRRRGDGGRDRARTYRMWKPLHDQPNEFHSADEFWELITAHVLLWGNAYAAKGRGADGLVNELVPLNPKQVQVGTDRNGRPFYVYTTRDLKQHTGGAEDVLHFRGLGLDGIMGLSPIQQARQMIGNGLALEEFQGRFWRNNARPGGVLRHPGELSDKAQKRLRASWQNMQGGLVNAGKTAILEEGMEWQSLGLPLADAQFIEQAKATRSDVALLFQLPAYKLNADSGSSMRYENTESEGIDYARTTLARWFSRFEGTLKRDPDLFLQAQAYYPEFLMDAWMRGDSGARASFYQKALHPTMGWMDEDEVRERENLNPFTDEQRARREAKAKAKQAPAAPAPAPAPPEPQGGNNDGGDDPQGGDGA